MIDIEALRFSYPGSNSVLLDVARLRVEPGEKVMLRGPSGSGKSTLLNLMAGILEPQAGRVNVCGEDLTQKHESAARDFRVNTIGFIFQDFALLDYLNVEDNILLPYRINPSLKLDASVRARMNRSLEELGIASKAGSHPPHLSFGERQRAAIARAMIAAPKVILADEPTANLDKANALKTIELILSTTARDKAATVVVSHDESLASYFDRVIEMSALSAAKP
ncbi:MAG TPA: ATP-binding cassette domain-containing protein [Planctomycetota bacterium]|nr:ATP-binding cassette domain-containing protein [Planctomycetota bacterium]